MHKQWLGRPFREEVVHGNHREARYNQDLKPKHPFFGYFRKDVKPQSNIKAAGIQEMQRQDSYHLYVGDWLHICGKTSERGVKNED